VNKILIAFTATALFSSTLSANTDNNNNGVWDDVESILSKHVNAGGVLRIELTRYTIGLQNMLSSQLKVQLLGLRLTKNALNCLDALGYEQSKVDAIKSKIYRHLIITFDDMEKIDQLQLIERSMNEKTELLKPSSKQDCSKATHQLISANSPIK
jgi:hypothetical protein